MEKLSVRTGANFIHDRRLKILSGIIILVNGWPLASSTSKGYKMICVFLRDAALLQDVIRALLVVGTALAGNETTAILITFGTTARW